MRLQDGLWGEIHQLNAEVILDHCHSWMSRIGWIDNFDRAAGTADGEHAGIEFVDSEVYKLLEAMAWELSTRSDDVLESRYRDLVRRIGAAQEPDGYLHTSFGREGQPARYSDLEWGHELYCFGHLIQAAVARLRTGHDDELPGIARRVADHLYREFGPEGRPAICGHPEVEMALAEFARATGDDRYLELAALLVDRRGHGMLKTTLFHGHDYFLDDLPVRDAAVLRGHAVRALYLSAGAADVAIDGDDDELLDAITTQWANTVARRTYITGGMGSHHQNEEFGDDYELPADRAYAETCASIGSVMLSWRLLLRTGEPKYADLIERTLLNGILVSPREDGRAFYYANTLHQRTAGTGESEPGLSERAEATLRAPWFEVSCCPTNIARTLASLPGYVATSDDDGIQVHQYAPMQLDTTLPDGRRVAFRVSTGYPFDERITIVPTHDVGSPTTLTLRIPAWAARTATATFNGQAVPITGATVAITRAFRTTDAVELVLPLEPRFTWPHPSVDAVRGQVAVESGPLVLALEDVDLPEGVTVDRVTIDTASAPATGSDGARVRLRIHPSQSAAWPFGDLERPAGEPLQADLIPYFRWANRGPSTMRVWIPVSDLG
ncbi:glycoside hydrolase family 127 protein [Microbacterium sp. W4I4]|uniref:glycoside hydrolase family 127 protein n=1 Tax=Microbacterium sp. W4I4 TaxID=3042295 RepID=UPI0027D81900|nr:beta-L-arabinofuranosidase domain-containing protein [Microbacterium sp. W4I4]